MHNNDILSFMKHFVFAISLFASILFFSVSSILGLSVTNEEGADGSYKIYCVIVFVFSLYYYFTAYIGKRITYKHLISIIVLLTYIVSGLLSGYADDTSFLVLVAFCLPASGIAVYYSERDSLSKMIKWIDVLLPVISLSLLFSLKQLFVEIAEGDSYYSQTLSYYSAYCLVLYLFFILFGKEYDRFDFFRTKAYRYFSYLMIPYLLVIMFFSGGRGALGTLAVGVLVLFYLYNRSHRIKIGVLVKSIIVACLFATVAYAFIPDDLKLVLESNFQRVFSFFDTSKDMMERTSGRDEVLNVAFEQIRESPIIGKGLFSYKDSFIPKVVDNSYPHNLFVEILLQGGYLFLFFFIPCLILLLIKLHHILKKPKHEMVAILAVFSLTLLMYSGSYMQNSFFWFFVFYVFNYKFKKKCMSKKILFISTMYPNPLRPGTPVCHYFTKEWREMGYDVLVIHFRAMFPAIYTIAAKCFPGVAKKVVGNHVEMDTNMSVVYSKKDGIPVYSIPIYKYVPHGSYSKKEINRKIKKIEDILSEERFIPDAIIGHFYNPQLEIVSGLKRLFPKAKTCVSLHEEGPVVKTLLRGRSKEVLDNIDIIGFRSVPIKKSFAEIYGENHNSLLCWSGTPDFFLNTVGEGERSFSDGPMHNYLYVGQTIKRKFPKQTVEGVHKAMGENDFTLTYVGSLDLGYPETVEYVERNNLNDKVVFTGKIAREEILHLYDSSDCFIMISKGEVFGLVYLEAMSRGCITIASHNEGMEGIIEHGVNGFLCEAGNSDELASIIRYINSLNAEEKKAVSDKARAKAAELSDYNVAKYYIERVFNCN